jgi:hypothetical protein
MRRKWWGWVLPVIMVAGQACGPQVFDDGGPAARTVSGKADAPSCPFGDPVDIPVSKGDPRLPSDQAAICLATLGEEMEMVTVICGDREVVLLGPREGALGDRYIGVEEGELHWIEIFSPERHADEYDDSEPFATDWVLPACRDQIEKPDYSGEPFTCPDGYFAADVTDYRQSMQSFLGGHYDTVEVCVPEGQARFTLTEYSNGWGYRFEQGSVQEVLVGCNGSHDTLSYDGPSNSYTNMSNFATDDDWDNRSKISIQFQAPGVDDPATAPETVTAESAVATTHSWGQIRYCD